MGFRGGASVSWFSSTSAGIGLKIENMILFIFRIRVQLIEQRDCVENLKLTGKALRSFIQTSEHLKQEIQVQIRVSNARGFYLRKIGGTIPHNSAQFRTIPRNTRTVVRNSVQSGAI